MQKLLLDTYCCHGGATAGYQRAGYYVVGVDKFPQPHYIGDEFVQGDAIEFILQHGHEFSAIHASPPCQRRTTAQRIQNREHPALIAPTRDALIASGRPYVIENVVGPSAELDDDPLIDPIMLCGAMFPELRVYRHRLFEFGGGVAVPHQPAHPVHVAKQTKMGRKLKPGEFMHVVGNFTGAQDGRDAMGINWQMPRDGLREAIPPVYAEWCAMQLDRRVG